MKYGLTTNLDGAFVFVTKHDAEVICAEVDKMYPEDGVFTAVKARGGFVCKSGSAYVKRFETPIIPEITANVRNAKVFENKPDAYKACYQAESYHTMARPFEVVKKGGGFIVQAGTAYVRKDR